MSFASATAVQPISEGLFRAEIPDGWQQGRGAFGGLVLGTLLRAMEAGEPGGRRARTLAGDICGPVVPGSAEVRVQRLRVGRSQTNVRADLVQGGEVQATALAVLGVDRPGDVRIAPSPPEPIDPESLPVLPLAPPFAAGFTVHYEYRSSGPLPLSGAAEAVSEGFIREKEPLDRLDAPAIVGRLDAFWPTLWSTLDALRPMATISFTAELLADPATLDPALPLRHRARAVHVAEGFLLEMRELWSGATPVAMNQQTFAILR